MQRNWIGKSSGLSFAFELCKDSKNLLDNKINTLDVYTTRADTIYGVSYCVIAPEHSIVDCLIEKNVLAKNDIEIIKNIRNQAEKERSKADKIGISLPIFVLHPLTQKKIPVWISNFVLMSYGSGAVMSVPSHDERDFEFDKKI